MGMGNRRLISGMVISTALLAGGVVVALREGVAPRWLNFPPPLRLDMPGRWYVDWQLSRLRTDRELCNSIVLRPPYIAGSAIPDGPFYMPRLPGCGWHNSVQLSMVGGASISVDRISCPMAAGLALWMAWHVQPVAEARFGKRVASVQHMGTYSCRYIEGDPDLENELSEHATANAIDISGFVLEDGRHISVFEHWSGPWDKADFLKTIGRGACRYFRAVLGPDDNTEHKDHFHFDYGSRRPCE